MLTKKNICSVQNCLRGTDRQQFENDKQNVGVDPPGKISADAHEWSCFLAFAFCYFRAFIHYESFVSFNSLNFGCKINRINPVLVIILSKLPIITNTILYKLLWVLRTIPNDN